MTKPIVREGIRLKPVAPGNLVSAKSFNPVQAIAEGLANLQVLVKLDGETISTQNIKLSGRNSVLELDLTGITSASGGQFRGLYQASETYNYGDTVLVMEEMVLFPETPAEEVGKNWWLTYWLWPHDTSSTTTNPMFDSNVAARSVFTLPDAVNFPLVPGTGSIPVVATSGGGDTAWLLLSVSKFFLPSDYSGDDTNAFTTLKSRGGEIRDVIY